MMEKMMVPELIDYNIIDCAIPKNSQSNIVTKSILAALVMRSSFYLKLLLNI